MKKVLLFLTICIGLISNSLSAQCDISNPSYETWVLDSVNSQLNGHTTYYTRPKDWSSLYTELLSVLSGVKPGIYKSTDAYVGTYSVELRANPLTLDSIYPGGDLFTEASCVNDPAELTGYVYTEGFDKTDSAIVRVEILNDEGDTVGLGLINITPNNKTWASFSCPIVYETINGTDATISLVYFPKSLPVYKTVKFDGLAFSGISSVNDATLQNRLRVFPNPFEDQLTLQNVKEGDVLKIYDILGNSVKSFSAVSNDPSISLTDLSNGIYFMEHNANGTISRVKVVKN